MKCPTCGTCGVTARVSRCLLKEARDGKGKFVAVLAAEQSLELARCLIGSLFRGLLRLLLRRLFLLLRRVPGLLLRTALAASAQHPAQRTRRGTLDDARDRALQVEVGDFGGGDRPHPAQLHRHPPPPPRPPPREPPGPRSAP